ncbi:oligosaccharide flippase family protein [Pigmentiphaga aceris]|uniref:Oligosaccharide flippase family protein n=1 Tax=Pigmentiphaga aceris TaxID=1940612 RepID=A0A5C0B572_9BURK|nr:oligosaccharide flippase family protein [Pigmentiphaga aceris]QEI08420.1 oligosaccharide flippase family protein [Pigmentiphaga aceris]
MMQRVSTGVRAVGWSLAGQSLPIVFALLTIPWLLHQLGDERMGFIALTWVVFGYMGLLDLGLSRVVTRQVAVLDRRGDIATAGALLWRAHRIALTAAVVFVVIVGIAVYIWLSGANRLTPTVAQEARAGLPWLMIAIPAAVGSNILRSGAEGLQRFALANSLRMTASAFAYAAPALATAFAPRLDLVFALIAVSRIILWALHWIPVRRLLPPSKHPVELGHMMREGGWQSISGLVGPLMTTLDRLIVTAVAGMSSLSFYAIPQEAIGRLQIVPTAVSLALFPRMSASADGNDHTVGSRLAAASERFVALAILPIIGGAMALIPAALAWWLGERFAAQGTLCAQILLVAALFNSLAHAPSGLIQSRGHARVTASVHLLQLLPFVAAVGVLTYWLGVTGAALAWTLRAVLDYLVLGSLAYRPRWSQRRGSQIGATGWALIIVTLTLGACLSQWLAGRPGALLGASVLLGLATVVAGWYLLLIDADRARIRQIIG